VTEIRTERIAANGLSFEVDVQGEGDRLALLLHGFPECAYSWRYQIPLLARLGYRVWAPNQRGYGHSSRPLGIGSYAIEHLMQDVAALIDASGAKQVLLAGHDWGGVVAWYFAMRGLRPLERLVILNVPHPGAARRGAGLRQLLRSWYVLFFQLPRLPEWVLSRRNYGAIADAFRAMAVDKSRFPDSVCQVHRRNAALPGALTAMVHWYRALVRGGGASRQHRLGYPVIEIPTLLLWGVEDRALGVETTHHTHEFVKDLTLRYLDGVSHWVQQEAPELVNAMLEAWLAGSPVPEASSLRARAGSAG
jgi:pimeloyl-ACP methyl ester carboxylesterase